MIRAIKARREGLSRRFGREIDGHEDRIFVMVVSVPYGLVAIGIKPLTYFGHHCGKLSSAYSDPDAVHSPLCIRLSMQPLKDSLDLKVRLRRAGPELSSR